MNIQTDGCELWSSTTYAGFWTLHSGQVDLSPNAFYGRNGKGLFFYFDRYLQKVLDTATDTLYWGGAIYFPPIVHNTRERLVGFFNIANMHIGLYVEPNMKLTILRNDGAVLGTTARALSVGRWHYVEFCAKVALSPNGWAQIWVDDRTGLGVDTSCRWLNLSGITTFNAALPDPNIDSYKMQGGNFIQAQWYLDDHYCNDSLGTENTGRWGDVKISALMPTSDSAPLQFTPTGGGAHYTQIDEKPPNTADYIEDNVLNHADQFGMENLLVSGAVKTAWVKAYMAKTEAGSRAAKIGLDSNGTVDKSTDIALSQSPAWYGHQVALNPDGSVVWTAAAINAAEGRAEVSV